MAPPSFPLSLLHTILLLGVHAIYSLATLLLLILSIRPSIPSFTEEDPDDVATRLLEDSKRWKKIPRHLSVVFVPPDRKRDARAEVEARRRMVEDVCRLARWCWELGLKELSVYDEWGESNSLQSTCFPPF